MILPLLAALVVGPACAAHRQAPPAASTVPAASAPDASPPPSSAPVAPSGVPVLAAWLKNKGIDLAPIERPPLALHGWTFFLVQYAPGAPGPTVGVGPNGELVTRDEPGGWDKLLAAGTAAELTERVAFLDNIAIVADPATSDPAARAWMSPPALGPGPTLTMWLAFPPSVDQPVRLVVACANGETTFTYTPWTDVAAGK